MANQFLRDYRIDLIGATETRTIKNLRIAFEVIKSSQSLANLLTLEIYNLSGATVEFINGQDPLVVLNAGYRGNLGLMFKGRITNSLNVRQGVDRITQIYGADGRRNLDSAVFNKTYSESVNIETIIKDLFNSILAVNNDLVLGAYEFDSDVTTATNIIRGQTFSASSKKILDQLALDYNFKWSIQDGEITLKRDYQRVFNSQEKVIIKQSTGMIGSPTITREAGGNGVTVTTLMNYDLKPDRAFEIQAETAGISAGDLRFEKAKNTSGQGLYRAFEVTHTGDTHTQAWYSIAKGRSL